MYPDIFIFPLLMMVYHFELNYVYSGSARQHIAEEERLLKTGELCIISPNMKHNVLVDDEQSLVISIMVRKSTFDLIFGSLLTHNDLLPFSLKIHYTEKSNPIIYFLKQMMTVLLKNWFRTL